MRDRIDRIAPGAIAKLSLALDLVLVLVVLVLTTGHYDRTGPPHLAVLAAVAASCWTAASVALRLYAPISPRTVADGLILRALANAATMAATGLAHTIFAWFFDHIDGNDFDAASFGLLLFAVGIAVQSLVHVTLETRFPGPLESVLVVGAGAIGLETFRRLSLARQPGQHVLGYLRFVDESAEAQAVPAPLLGTVDDLLATLTILPVDEVYIAGDVLTQAVSMQRAVQVCEELGVPFALPIFPLRIAHACLLSPAGSADGFLHFMTAPPKVVQYALKRLIDILVSSLALVALLPIMGMVAVAIKLTSSGPVLFRQIRVGMHGARFNLFKFRSMAQDAELRRAALESANEQTGPVFKMKNDPRVTPLGRVLRKYSLDELPQLVNVLRGDMTLVGPRPALPSEVVQYTPHQRRRLSVRPGLTCLWQVCGRNKIGFDEWMQLDMKYIDEWSLRVDAQLLLQTVPVVLLGKNSS